MRIVVHGQQAFGKAVLEALLERGDDVVAVYAPPEGSRPDPLAEAALAAGLPLVRPASFRAPFSPTAPSVRLVPLAGAKVALPESVVAPSVNPAVPLVT